MPLHRGWPTVAGPSIVNLWNEAAVPDMDEQEPRNGRPMLGVLSVFALAADLIVLLLLAYLTTVVRGNFEEISLDFGTTASALTGTLLLVPNGAYLSFLTAVGILLVIKEVTITNQSVKLGLNIVVGMAMLAFAALFYLALLTFVFNLTQSFL